MPKGGETSRTHVSCAETQISTIEAAFADFTSRKDIAILLINQHVSSSRATIRHWPTPEQIAEKIRPTVDKYQQAFPALLEIPSKDHPYGRFVSFG
jgi:V-type H+-transporting ATPase subunit F